MSESELPGKRIRCAKDVEELDALDFSIVYFWVQWSGPELAARRAIGVAARSLPDVRFFNVEEDSQMGSSLKSRWTERDTPSGAGDLLIFEKGRLVGSVAAPGRLSPDDIVGLVAAATARPA